MREQDDQLNEDSIEEPIITGIDLDPEDEPVLELPENAINNEDEIEELYLGER